jgi:hypothetical protein
MTRVAAAAPPTAIPAIAPVLRASVLLDAATVTLLAAVELEEEEDTEIAVEEETPVDDEEDDDDGLGGWNTDTSQTGPVHSGAHAHDNRDWDQLP